ncbi:hypothetical protein CL622_06500 [archaeon]|nr:hypothetical protein [archaeon]|tara:strand:- start:1022 stop:1411 length:390 start_codon:yes stop_codon:yes gene_type:complete
MGLIKKLILVVAIVGVVFFFGRGAIDGNATREGPHDALADCLTDSGAKMYGAYWCPHCLDQKAMFGDSWNKVNYIECSLPNRGGQTRTCDLMDIESYPTWEFGDGSRQSGALTLDELAEKSGCNVAEAA